MALGVLEVFVFGFMGFIAIIIFLAFIRPRYDKEAQAIIENPAKRERSLLIDKNIPGVIAEIEGKIKGGDSTKITYTLVNRYGRETRTYSKDAIVPFDSAQATADPGAPVFITLESKYTKSEYEQDVNDILATNKNIIKELEYYKREHRYVQSQIDVQVEKRLKDVMGNEVQRRN